MRVDNAFELFLMEKEVYCTSKTMLYYRENVGKFIDYLKELNVVDSFEISRDLIIGYVSRIKNTGVKNTTVNTYFRAVKCFLNYCIDEEYCNPDILRRIRLLKSDNDVIIPLTQDEVDDIDGCFSEKTETGLRNLCIIHLMLDAGCRCSDIVNLRYKDISFNNNYLELLGKGNKYRSVLLAPCLKKMLYKYLVTYRAYVPGENYPVFARIGSPEPITNNSIKQLFARLKVKSGVDRLHPHLCRHTFATSYILGGGNMEFLRMMLGHTDYSTTKMYLHLAQQSKMLQSDVYKLDPVFFRVGY